MTEPDDLRSELHEIASMIDVGDPARARSDVGAVVRRRRRRRTGAGLVGVLLVAVAGISAIAWAGRSTTPRVLVGVEPSTPSSTAAGSTTTSTPSTTASTTTTTESPGPTVGMRSVRATEAVGVTVENPPFASQDPGAMFVAPWLDGFLAVVRNPVGQVPAAWFSADGVEWDPIEFVLPDGVQPQYYTVGGDRLVAVQGAAGRSAITVLSSSDLVTWSAQTIEPAPPPISLPAFVKPTLRPSSIVANDDGWILAASQGVRLAAREIIPAEALAGIDDRTLLPIDVGEDGVVVNAGPDGPSFRYSWDELGVDAEQYAYIAEGSNSGFDRWWSATWDGQPVPATGTGVPTDDGFVQIGTTTQFSSDGVTWTPASDLALPEVTAVALPYGEGIVVVGIGDASPVVRLDARGRLTERIDIDGLPPVQMPFSVPWDPTAALVYSSTAVPQPLQVMENDGYRLTYDPALASLELVDVASGAVVVAENRDTFEATGVSSLAFGEDGSVTISDPESGEVIVRFPSELVQQSMQDTSDALSQFVPDLHLVATADGGEFVAVDLPDDADGGTYQTVVNGTTALVGIDGVWSRYELP